MNRILVLLTVLIFFSQGIVSNAQTFELVDPGFNKCLDPAAAWVDIDNDGDLDVFMSGVDDTDMPASHLYRNDGGGAFYELTTSITGLTMAACAFGDMNNDGLADLAICGYDGNSAISAIYRNDGGFVFTNIGAGIEGLSEGSIAWTDYNNDAYPDLLISGLNDMGSPRSMLYENAGGTQFTDTGIPIYGLTQSSLAWSDFDGDEDMDFAICGRDSLQLAKTLIYVNDDGNFAEMGAGLAGLWGGMLAWGDYNNDGYADLVISGTDDNNVSASRVYKNNAGGSFTQLTGPFSAVSDGSALWGDFDNDGDLDFILAGRYSPGGTPPPPADDPFLNVYFNQGSDQFQAQWISLPAPTHNDIVCGDYDNDSDLDLLLTGAFVTSIGTTDNQAVIFRNETSSVNNPPAAPSGLSYLISGLEVSFQWDPTTDDKTPSAGLNYNFRLGTQPDNMDMLSALADLSDGYRRIAEIGNTGVNTAVSVLGLPFGEYYASVQAIDHSYAGSPFSDDITIMFLPTATFFLEDSICTGELTTITYTGTASTAAQYTWDFDGAVVLSGSGQGPYVVYWDEENINTVSLTVIENGMTSETVSNQVQVIEPVTSSGTITGETEFCQGTESTEYIVSPVVGAITYDWELNPSEAGTISGNGLQVVAFWNAAFAGNVSIKVRGGNYCGTGPYSGALEVEVQPKPGKPGIPEGPEDLCRNPENSIYETSGALNGLSYMWEVYPENAGSILSNGLQAEVDWDDTYTGQAEIIVTSSNTCGEGPVSDTLYVVILIPPDANAGDDQVIPYQTDTQLHGSASGGSGNYLYFWTPDDLLVNPAVMEPTTLSLDESVQFTFTVTDEETGCNVQDQMIVIVTGGPLSVEVTADPEEVCYGESTQLLALPSGGSGNYIYTWSSDPVGFNSSDTNPSASPFETTKYYVEVSDEGDIVSDSVEVVVDPLPSSAGEIDGPVQVCPGDEEVLYVTDPVANAIQYLWELAEGIYGSSDSTSILVSFSDPPIVGVGSIAVTPVNSCGFGEMSVIEISYGESPGIPQSISGPDSLCTTTDTVNTYTVVIPVPGALDYEWLLLPEEAGTVQSNGQSANIHWANGWEGDAVLIVRALNDCGYSDWSAPYEIYTFTCLGIHDNDDFDVYLKLYPNPVTDILNVELSGLNKYEEFVLNVWDIYGRKMEELEVNNGQDNLQINTSYYTQGLYIIRLLHRQKVLIAEKFIVSR